MRTETGPEGRRESLFAVASLLAAVAIWGTFFPLVAVLLRTWDPLPSAAARLVCGAVVLVVMVLLRQGWRMLAAPLPWRRVLILSFFGIAVFNLATTWGVAYSGPISASIVATAGPVVAAFMQRVMYGTRLRREILVASLLAVAGGVCVAFAHGDGPAEFRGGEILILCASTSWLWYSMKIQDWFPGESQGAVTAVTYVVGAIGVTLLAASLSVLGISPDRVDLSAPSLLLLLVIGVSSTAMAVTFWLYGVARLGITVAAVYGNMVPLVTVLCSAVVGIAPRPLELLGGAIVIAGVVLVQVRARTRA
ncbi:MAG: DMT family transporter [Alphaproteobacteria bacterium]|nr:DMT family transporter [Alphaproteobacteria bacterium]